MLELPLIFLGGLLGSSHCLGMCGGFAVLLGVNSTTTFRNFCGQCSYSVGRIFTYTVLGMIAGFAGERISLNSRNWLNASATLSLLAGIFLILQGLKSAGISFRRNPTVSTPGCLTSPLFKTFFQSRSLGGKFLAGVLTGFLPCGLLYAFLALAAAAQDLVNGGLIMFAFGSGTVPLMVLAGIGGKMLSALGRQRVLQIAAWCVVVTGAITVYRGIGYFQLGPDHVPPGCPWCPPATQSVIEFSSSRLEEVRIHDIA